MSDTTEARSTRVLTRAFALGFACGLRSIVGFSSLAFFQGRDECANCAPGPLETMRTDVGKALLGAATVGELIADKLPVTPARIAPAPLLGRLGFGAASGFLATMATQPNRDGSVATLAALLGASGAGVGAVTGYLARTIATHRGGVPDAPVALVEDAAAIGLASIAARS